MAAIYFVLLAALLATSQASASPLKLAKEWKLFKQQFNKTFHNVANEARHRFNLEAVLDKINKHNERQQLGLASYSMKVYNFSDQTMAEFASTHGGVALPPNRTQETTRHETLHRPTNQALLPRSVDWRRHGVVSAVRSQLTCGSCWAFSVAGTIEGQVARKSRKPAVALSPQNLIDCVDGPNPKSCSTGQWPVTAYEWIKNNGGMEPESSYPYEDSYGTCRFNNTNAKGKVTSWVTIDNEQALVDAIANVGPVSVTVATGENFISYSQGVFYNPDCSTNYTFHHAMLAVGYGRENGHDYYLIKNSWGSSWGENGYIKMSRNRNNNCDIATYASYPQIA